MKIDRLVKEQINDLIEGGEIKPVEMPNFEGTETVKVAVTGALPPMDYVAAGGTPAGFNTAVLAEIGNRLGKSNELVVEDSLGRAAALASGAVDAVFWTRTSDSATEESSMTEAERKTDREKEKDQMTEEEISIMQDLERELDMTATYASADMPDGTIVTETYFSDVLVPVFLVGEASQSK